MVPDEFKYLGHGVIERRYRRATLPLVREGTAALSDLTCPRPAQFFTLPVELLTPL